MVEAITEIGAPILAGAAIMFTCFAAFTGWRWLNAKADQAEHRARKLEAEADQAEHDAGMN